ncbi:B-cell antigen receptor complex-associated protein alpha chain isoform X2 [Sardina pilchardus]|uniref:B-cell antigen receptor complex-associated protein alpha chain isoform X2 n=1 Tax=Sardina pilchardus TaxID=27697 RepID=UPI002E0E3C0D
MDITVVFLFCVCTDQPSQRVPENGDAILKCCYDVLTPITVNHTWVIRYMTDNNMTCPNDVSVTKEVQSIGSMCQSLSLAKVQLNNTGFYQCRLKKGTHCIYSHGTYLQVFTPMKRTLDISESWKNSIITIEGVLLLFSVLLPGICQLGKTKRLTELNRRKQREEENIYEGLNLDGCDSTYYQIQRSDRHGPYQDVANVAEDDTQFEKP